MSTTQHNPGPVSHPTREEWMAFIYKEVPRERRATLDAHLAGCSDCTAQVQQWRRAMSELDTWALPEREVSAKSKGFGGWTGGMRWAAAAAVLLAAGFLAGRANSGALNTSVEASVREKMNAARTELATDLRQTMLREFAVMAESNRVDLAGVLGEFASAINGGRAADQQSVLAAVKELDAKWLAIYASFRRELETVAILTETGLKDTQQQLVQMANFNTPKE